MPEDAMDLNDEGVEAAARVLYDRVKSVPTLTYDIAYPSEQDDFRRVASAMLTAYLRAVPESDELVRLRALLDEASRSSHQNGQLFTKGAMHPGSWERCEAMSCSDARAALSPDEVAGDE